MARAWATGATGGVAGIRLHCGHRTGNGGPLLQAQRLRAAHRVDACRAKQVGSAVRRQPEASGERIVELLARLGEAGTDDGEEGTNIWDIDARPLAHVD